MGLNIFVMNKLRLLYIFTSGTLSSANNKQWFKLFFQNKNIEVFILINDCPEEEKETFFARYNTYYKIIFFKPLKEISQNSLLSRLKYVKSIAHKIDSFAIDIIHIHGCYYSYPVKTLFFLHSHPKIIYNVWGNDYNTMFFSSLKHRLIISYLFRRANLIWTNWFAMANTLKRRFPKSKKIKTIFWGVEKSVFQLPDKKVINRVQKKYAINENDYILLYAKGFTPLNNHLKLLQALALLQPSVGYKLILHSAKNPEYEKELRAFIEKKKLIDKVIISHDPLSDEEMKALFHVADLSFVIPEKDQFTRTITETIFMGTNLILSDIEPYRYLNSVYGFDLDLVNVNQPKLFAEILQHYIDTKPVPDWRYQKTVFKHIFDFEAKADAYLKIYQDLKNADS